VIDNCNGHAFGRSAGHEMAYFGIDASAGRQYLCDHRAGATECNQKLKE
jgi:hypothetical protein